MRRIGVDLLSFVTFLMANSFSTNINADAIRPGDRVIFLGDSITQDGAEPGGYVTLFREAINVIHPDWQIEIVGAGVSGNTVSDIALRLDGDVLVKKPTIVVIYIGINDTLHAAAEVAEGVSANAYRQGLTDVIDRITAAGARPVVCTPSVLGERIDGTNPHDKILDKFCAMSRAVADEKHVQLIDLRKQFVEHLRRHNEKNVDRGILTSDTVHLNAVGNQFVAHQMLSALSEANSVKSVVASHTRRTLRHVVLFKFKPEIKADQIAEITSAFEMLPKKIEGVESLEWGTDNSPEGLARGFTHCFLITFRDEAARAAYLPHPEHQKFVDLVKPRLADVFVVDYWAE